MGVNSLPKTVTRQRRDCDLNLGPSAPESSMLTTRLPSHRWQQWGLFWQGAFSLGTVQAPAELLLVRCRVFIQRIQPPPSRAGRESQHRVQIKAPAARRPPCLPDCDSTSAASPRRPRRDLTAVSLPSRRRRGPAASTRCDGRSSSSVQDIHLPDTCLSLKPV